MQVSRIGQLNDDDIWLQLPEFISVLLCYCQSRWGLKNNSLNLHKKTANSRILVVVVKWRHRAIALLLLLFLDNDDQEIDMTKRDILVSL